MSMSRSASPARTKKRPWILGSTASACLTSLLGGVEVERLVELHARHRRRARAALCGASLSASFTTSSAWPGIVLVEEEIGAPEQRLDARACRRLLGCVVRRRWRRAGCAGGARRARPSVSPSASLDVDGVLVVVRDDRHAAGLRASARRPVSIESCPRSRRARRALGSLRTASRASDGVAQLALPRERFGPHARPRRRPPRGPPSARTPPAVARLGIAPGRELDLWRARAAPRPASVPSDRRLRDPFRPGS